MTSEEAIKAIKMAISEVEREYPLEYAAFDMDVEALEKQSKGEETFITARMPMPLPYERENE